MTERRFEDVQYSGADGRLRLFARDYPPAPVASSGDAPAPALLMMHGLTRNSADFEPLIGHLDPRHRIIVPDQRGRGRSDYDPEPGHYRPDVYVADMWSLLDHLGIDTVVAIGTSMGGIMGMLMAGAAPSRIAGLVLNDIGPEVSAGGLGRLRSYVGVAEDMKDWDDAARRCEAINGDALENIDADGWAAFARRTCEKTEEGAVRFAYDPAIAGGLSQEDTSAAPPDMWPLWDELHAIPVLALRGAKSDILERDTLAEMRARHPAAMASVEVPARGHAPLLDEPEAVAAIKTFLKDNFA